MGLGVVGGRREVHADRSGEEREGSAMVSRVLEVERSRVSPNAGELGVS